MYNITLDLGCIDFWHNKTSLVEKLEQTDIVHLVPIQLCEIGPFIIPIMQK